MCGRFALFSEPSRFAEFLDAELALDPEAFRPSWNVGPTRTILGVAERADGHRSLGAYRWGLVPGWAKEPSAIRSTFNARAETVATKPTFRSAFRRGRILIPADAFYEWQTEGRVKTPFAFTRADGNPIVFAGLGEPGRGPDHPYGDTATVITTTAGPDMAGIHDRMPVILEPDAWAHWLDPAVNDHEALEPLLRPAPPGTIVHHPVDRAVGNIRNDGPQLLSIP